MVDGIKGDSAYQIAVENGFEGTEEDWLNSLKGEKGDKGETGQQGKSNTLTIGTVEKGEEASANITGESPNQTLNLVLPKGDVGEKGDNGQDGYTPVKGTDYFTEAEIQQIKQDILAEVSSFDLLVVDNLPTENIQEKTIYLTPNTETTENNVYDEYIYVNGSWEVIGSTAVDTDNLTVNLVENSYKLTLTEAVAGGGTITLPSTYKVGADRLDVYLNGEKLIKAETSDTEGHYYEVGTEGTLSNTIQITSDWTAEVGDVFEFTIRTNGEGKAEENLDIYSTEEQVIGKWIDGKLLYRKVIKGIVPEITEDGTYISSVINIADNIDMATIVNAFVLTKDNIIINLPYITGEGNQIKAQISSDRLLTIYNGIKGYSNASLVACLEYTKTTDTGEV